MPTIKDVAHEAGVSIATVSYVLNNKTDAVSEKTRLLVLEAVERVGYTPNVNARNLKSSQTRLIGYAWHEVPNDQVNSVLDRFTYSLAQSAEAAGYHVLTFTHPSDSPVAVYDELIRTNRVDAFVLAGTSSEDVRIGFLQDQHFPFVSFGRSNPEWVFPCVDVDGRQGVREAVDYLIALGHTRIAMAAWPPESIAGEHRLSGYREALWNAGISARPDYVLRGEHSAMFGSEVLTKWLELPADERPTAIVAISDLVAVGIMNEAHRRGLVVGEDLSVIGFDDAPMAQYLRPSLTTVAQPITEIAQALMEMLEAQLRKQPIEPHSLLIPPRLIIRESCGRWVE